METDVSRRTTIPFIKTARDASDGDLIIGMNCEYLHPPVNSPGNCYSFKSYLLGCNHRCEALK